MILQALTRYYETLAAKGEIPRDGWADVKVSWALELDRDGNLLSLIPLSEKTKKNGKLVDSPRILSVPTQFKRTVGIQPNFLCDNPAYVFGLAKSEQTKDRSRALDCFKAAKDFHLTILGNCTSPAAVSVRAYYQKWDPETAAENPVLKPMLRDIMAGAGNLTFFVDERFAAEDAEIAEAWQKTYQDDGDGETMICLISGREAVPTPVHPAIKGVRGAQSSGAAIVSFNAESFTSFGKEQSLNAPVSKYAAFAYTTALNRLIADASHRKFIGDATVVYWAENAESAEQDFFSAFLDGGNDAITDEVLDSAMKRFASGQPVDLEGITVSASDRFFVLALSPNNARVAVRFFYDTTFGELAANFSRFYDETAMDGAQEHLPLWRMLAETSRKTADGKSDPSPQVSGDMLRALLTGCDFPETFYQRILMRVRAEKNIGAVKASSIKAFLLRNRQTHPDYAKYKEVLGVKLNEESTYLPYVLGELFAVLEAIQETASGASTIKDRFFTSACTTPALVFPRLISLASYHLRKLEGGTYTFYSRQLGELMQKITESYPGQLNLNDQGIFQIGYYHKRQKRFDKASQKKENKEDNTNA